MAASKIILITGKANHQSWMGLLPWLNSPHLGGNTGIGYETVKALLRSDKPYHILLAGRDLTKARNAAKASKDEVESQSSVEAVQIDVESDESISKAYEGVAAKHPRIDCLINNAGQATVRSCST